MSFPACDESRELNRSTRREAPGSFINLSDGVTHYEAGGRLDGEKVILVPGFSVPYFIFDPTFKFFIDTDFHVLRYDLFGRGWSDRPRVVYNMRLFVRQLRELVERLNFSQVNLVGLSMGGAIAAAFAIEYPDSVKKLALIDPVGAQPIEFSSLLKLAKTPFIGELFLGLFGKTGLLKSLASDFYDPILVEQLASRYQVQMQFQGFKRAILSTVRNNMLGSFIETYERINRLDLPVLLIWGRYDTTVPFYQHNLLCEAMPKAEFHAIENCGHIPHYEKPGIVNPILLQFLQ